MLRSIVQYSLQWIIVLQNISIILMRRITEKIKQSAFLHMTYLRNLNIGCEMQLSQELLLPGLLDFIAEEELGHKQGVV